MDCRISPKTPGPYLPYIGPELLCFAHVVIRFSLALFCLPLAAALRDPPV